MGNYADWEDVAGRYQKISTVVDSQELQASYLAGVEAIMNSYLAKQFTIPVSDKPPLLTDIAIDLAYAKIMVHKDQSAQKIWDRAMAILKNILAGDVLLIDTDGSTIPTLGSVAWSTTKDYHDSFSMLGIDDRIDPDLIDDLASERDMI